MNQNTKQVIFRTTEQKKHQLRILAAQQNQSINEYLNSFIEKQWSIHNKPYRQYRTSHALENSRK